MKTVYRISSKELGTVLLKRRKIAKALRWWLRENGFVYKYMFFVMLDHQRVQLAHHPQRKLSQPDVGALTRMEAELFFGRIAHLPQAQSLE